jgi:hypothetical protein
MGSTKPSFDERLQSLPMSQPWDGSEELWRYREAAAVLASFDYQELRARGEVSASSSRAKVELLADCDNIYSAGGKSLWSLQTPVRRAALRRILAENRVDEALAANPQRADTVVQKTLEQFLSGKVRPITTADIREEGTALLEVISWLEGLIEYKLNLPSTDWIKQILAREQLLEPFRSLVGTRFAGRLSELADLSDYVGLYDSQSISESFNRSVEHIFNLRERPPLFIHGPGGSGKSSLICKFILNHAEVVETDRFPFAYLDFDRRGLVPEEPLTLLVEIMRQLAIQFPNSSEQYRTIVEQWRIRFSQKVNESDESASSLGMEPSRFQDRSGFLQEFAEFVNGLKTTDQILLLVLDTFEEVQFRSAAYVEEVLDFLNDLQSRVPRTRTVMCGRVPLRSERYKVRPLKLGDFDEPAALGVLSSQGISDPQLAQNIFQQVGGSPLMLRLAADVVKLDKATPETGLEGLGWLSTFWEKSKEVVLYKRILTHIVDKRVEQLAYPGLVLRVITPLVLLEVLAPACSVSVTSLDDARGLIQTMHDQLSTILVPSIVEPETLVHRADMRSILLQDVSDKVKKDADVAQKLQKIHASAIQFYARAEDSASRAEEIYHRLAVGIDRAILVSRWQNGLTPYLGSSIRELPEQSQIYLAARLNLELPANLWTKAADEDWILYAARFVAQTIELQKPEPAISLLRVRRTLWKQQIFHPSMARMMDMILREYARQFEHIRAAQKSGPARTERMTAVLTSVMDSCRVFPPDQGYAHRLFADGAPGLRIVALGIAQFQPQSADMDIAIQTIANSLSPFEQYQALRLARLTVEESNASQRTALRKALLSQNGISIHDTDPSRWKIRDELLRKL